MSISFPLQNGLHDWSCQLNGFLVDRWSRFTSLADQSDSKLISKLSNVASQAFWQQLGQVWVGSDFIFEYSCLYPHWLLLMATESQIQADKNQLKAKLEKALENVRDEAQLAVELRQFRNFMQASIIWRDLARLATLEQTTAALSAVASVCLECSYRWLYKQQEKIFGVPEDSQGLRQDLVIIGMGKLGAQELNVSSDIDLIFTYPSGGKTQGGSRQLDNQAFFVKLAQKLIRALDQITEQGFVFRVDMRLRPYGTSGPLVLSFAAMEQYYQDQGRDWERYAMIKAQVVAGDIHKGEEFLAALKPFVFRRYLDFGAIEALRDMKQRILKEATRKGKEDDVKLGTGGIREIEFIGQVFQLIHGGRDINLQQRPIRKILKVLATSQYLPNTVVLQLDRAYELLRNTEHALQALHDAQTQALPTSDFARMRLAFVMGFADWPSFISHLQTCRQQVAMHFEQIIASSEQEKSSRQALPCWIDFWQQENSEEAALLFERHGYTDPMRAIAMLQGLRQSRLLQSVRRQSLDRINLFMPVLLTVLGRQKNPDHLLVRLFPLVEAVLRRTSYLVLLMENPKTLEALVKLSQDSAWVAQSVSEQPILLDDLLNLGGLISLPDKQQLQQDLQQRMVHLSEDDLEQQLEALRQFKQSHTLKVNICLLREVFSTAKASLYLSELAEVILESVLDIAWQQLSDRYGLSLKYADKQEREFIVIAYGKLGSMELNLGSDLDLVFVQEAGQGFTDQEDLTINPDQFFMRLAQRLMHMLTVQTHSGQLYEIDTRLRPSGTSGLLVSNWQSFSRYQREKAWIWESMALVKARPIGANQRLIAQFNALRSEVLKQKREPNQLREAVLAMRKKMRDHLGTSATCAGQAENAWSADQSYHLKQDFGGLVDIEFIVQYMVLAWAWRYPELTRYTSNRQILKQLKVYQLLSVDEASELYAIYETYSQTVSQKLLQNEKVTVSAGELHVERQTVIRIWQSLLVNS